ncbi:MAG: 30S ribosomal protein S5 [Opitutales bacterium]
MSKQSKSFSSAEETTEAPELVEKVVHINRCAKVVKGGRRFSFAALVVTGNQNGGVGFGYGKAKEVPEAIRKGGEQARKNMIEVKLRGDTLPHSALGEADGGKVLLRPASDGTGIIAGGGVRAVLEAAGVKNVLSKSLGSNNYLATVNATMHALKQMRTNQEIKSLRFGDTVEEEAQTEANVS